MASGIQHMLIETCNLPWSEAASEAVVITLFLGKCDSSLRERERERLGT